MDEKISTERRLVFRILDYWNLLRGERPMPALEEIDPAALGADWHDSFLLQREGTGGSVDAFRFQHIGQAIQTNSALPADWCEAANSIDACPAGSLLARSVAYNDRVLAKKVPISIGDVYPEGGSIVKFRSILLPLAADGETIDALFGAVNCLRVVALEDVTIDA